MVKSEKKGDDTVSKYIENVNTYLSRMKIKRSFISLKTGMDASKLSRILTGGQDVTSNDMEKIAHALGQRVEFFLTEPFCVPDFEDRAATEVAFYAGEPSKEQELFAMKLIDFIEHIDEVLGAKGRFLMAVGSE